MRAMRRISVPQDLDRICYPGSHCRIGEAPGDIGFDSRQDCLEQRRLMRELVIQRPLVTPAAAAMASVDTSANPWAANSGRRAATSASRVAAERSPEFAVADRGTA